MSNMINLEFPSTPITEETFKRQEWNQVAEHDVDEDGNVDEYYFWELSLPRDNPDENCAKLISSANDEYTELGLKKGQYIIELEGFFGLGISTTEEELETLYKVLTKKDIEMSK